MTDTVRNDPRLTARDVLERVAGEEHALHSVMARTLPYKGRFTMTCSCKEVFEAPARQDYTDGVRNVPVFEK